MYASTGQHSPSCPDYECTESGFPVRGWGSSKRSCEVVSLPVHTPARCSQLGNRLWISMSLVPTQEQKEGGLWLCLRCCSCRGWLTQAMCCIHVWLFKVPWCFDLQPQILQGPRSTLHSKALIVFTCSVLQPAEQYIPLLLTPHLLTVTGWVTCILSRHINRMTGHHRLQEQLTPPHNHLCV